MKKILFIILLTLLCQNLATAQSFHTHAKIVGLQHRFPQIMGQGLEVGGSLKSKNEHFKVSLAYYNYVGRGVSASTTVVNNRFNLTTYDHTRSEEGVKLGFGYIFDLNKKWKIGTDLSLIKANVEIISQDKYYPIKSEAKIQNIPFPAYYAYRDYLGQADISIIRRLKKKHDVFFSIFYAQSPWNSSLSRNWGMNLGMNFNIFNFK